MKRYRVTLNGCDDSTSFDLELTDAEFSVVKKISELSIQTSNYGCMPTLTVEETEGPAND